jgi:hypothetical protein
MSAILETLSKSLESDAELQAELEQTATRLAELRREKKLRDLKRSKERRAAQGARKPPAKPPDSPPGTDYAYGVAAIGRETGQKPNSVYYTFANGGYGDAVWKLGPRTLVGRISKLRNLGPRD